MHELREMYPPVIFAREVNTAFEGCNFTWVIVYASPGTLANSSAQCFYTNAHVELSVEQACCAVSYGNRSSGLHPTLGLNHCGRGEIRR